jgi:molybdate transport system substrate-binding protein
VGVSEVARSFAKLASRGQRPRETFNDICVARFAVRCHLVRGFEGGRGEGRPPWIIGPVPDVREDALKPTPPAVAPRGYRRMLATVMTGGQALLDARLVAMPGSTSGLFVKNEVLPKLAIADKESTKVMPPVVRSPTALLAAREADLAIGPMSELHNQPGAEIVGPLPDEVRLQIFTAAIVKNSRDSEDARRLIQFLASDRTTAAIRRKGLQADPVSDQHS